MRVYANGTWPGGQAMAARRPWRFPKRERQGPGREIPGLQASTGLDSRRAGIEKSPEEFRALWREKMWGRCKTSALLFLPGRLFLGRFFGGFFLGFGFRFF